MPKIFEKGKRYYFSKDAYLADAINALRYKSSPDIQMKVSEIEGWEVEVTTSIMGRIGGCVVLPEHCQEYIPSTRKAVKIVINELYKGEKTMKTWEMVKALQENPRLKFKNKRAEGTIFVNESGYLVWDKDDQQELTLTFPGFSKNCSGNINDGWEVVQEPVDFMPAVNSGKRMRPVGEQKYMSIQEVIIRFYTTQPHGQGGIIELMNGLWEIEQ